MIDVRNTKAALDVLDERLRQQTVEGWSQGHDDNHEEGAICAAAATYTVAASRAIFDGYQTIQSDPPALWPWDASSWRSSDPRRALVKAAALLLAEIERIDRKVAEKPKRYRIKNISGAFDEWEEMPPNT